jgi:drug/metabolite transporter (DMT)-like permease
MSYIYPFVKVIAEVTGKTIDKFNFKKNKVEPFQEFLLVFIVMVLLSSIYPIFSLKSFPAFSIFLVSLCLLMILISFFQNLFEFHGLQIKDLSYREMFIGIQPVLTMLFAFLLFPSERKISYIIGIILSVIILYFGTYQKHWKFKQDKGTIYILLAILCSAILANIYKYLLNYLLPQFLFMIRVVGVLILLLLVTKISYKFKNNKTKVLGSLAGVFYFIGVIAYLLSIKHLGLNLTIILLFLHPVLTYFLSAEILKEKLNFRRMISNILLLIVVFLIVFVF